MPQTYPASGPNAYKIPQYTEKADGVAAFQQFIDSLEPLITPIGTIVPWAAGDQSTVPAGWLLCDGNNYPRDRYKSLAALLGTTWGTAPDGFFKVPNLKGRMLVGLDPSDPDFSTIGKMDGSKSVTLSSDNLPGHSHSVPAHGHTASANGSPAVEIQEAGNHAHAGSTANSNGEHQHITGYTSKKGAGNLPDGTVIPVDDAQNNDKTGNAGAHTHGLSIQDGGKHKHTASVDATGISVKVNDSAPGESGDTGTSKPFLSLGPYAVVHYIIRADIVRS